VTDLAAAAADAGAAGAPAPGFGTLSEVQARSKPIKASLKVCEPTGSPRKPGSVVDEIPFLFNPKDYSLSMSASWKHEPAKKPKPPEFTGNQPRSLTFEMFLDRSEEEAEAAKDVSKDVAKLFSCLAPTQKTLSQNKPSPPFVEFTWGATRFVGYVKSVNATFTLFRPDGKPVRATAKVAIDEFTLEVPRQNPTSGGLTHRRSHEVVEGDTLASIAYAEYDKPTAWRAIATANGIDDPMRLAAGTRLAVPPASEAKAMQ
jgi:nucleoid-associated protein YgaU